MSLEDDYKEMFLDVACILKGESKKDATRILESCGFHAANGLKVLEQRSLITISCKYGGYGEVVLGMHDHIEEMGKHIVRRKHPNEPNKHSHLWIQEEIEEILANDMGTEKTRCLKLDGVLRAETRIPMNGFGKMKKLRYLELKFYHFKSDAECLDDTSQYFPNSLIYLKCTDYPYLYLPKTFQANNLVGLEMKDLEMPMVQLWKEGENKVLNQLKFVSLSRTSRKFKWFSKDDSFNDVPNRSYIPRPKLKYINIGHSELRAFDLGLTPNIETLSLRYFPNLGELCMPVSCQKLKHLVIRESKLRTFDIGLTPNLETLSLFDCADFVELHVSVACPNLKFLDICGSSLRSLDLELIPNLERLVLKNCIELVKMNAPIGCLKKVGYVKLNCWRYIDFKFGGRYEPKVGRASASLDLVGTSPGLSCPLHPTSNLLKLWFRSSYKENLSSSVGNIEKLMSFGLCICTDLKKFSDMICSLCCLKELKLKCNVPEFPKNLGQLECLEKLHLSSTKIKHLPDSICMLKHLKSLTVEYGDLLEKLPEDLGQLECLEKLHVSSKIIEYLPDSICMLKRLKWLYVQDCPRLGKLHEDIRQLESLERLVLTDTAIKHLPDSVCVLKHLKYLDLDHCALLEKLPEDLGRLECLKELAITDTEISHLPQSIFGLRGLLVTASLKLLQR